MGPGIGGGRPPPWLFAKEAYRVFLVLSFAFLCPSPFPSPSCNQSTLSTRGHLTSSSVPAHLCCAMSGSSSLPQGPWSCLDTFAATCCSMGVLLVLQPGFISPSSPPSFFPPSLPSSPASVAPTRNTTFSILMALLSALTTGKGLLMGTARKAG